MKMKEIWIDAQIPLLEEALRHNEANGWRFCRFEGRSLTSAELRNCVALCVRSTTQVNAQLLTGSAVRFVGTATSGAEHCDAEYLARAGIRFADAKGCNANAVAEYLVFATLLWAERQGRGLSGETMGVIGYGNIGRRVVRYALALGMKALVYDPPLFRRNPEFARRLPDGAQAVESLQELCAASNALTNHVPLVSQGRYPTANVLNAGVLRAFGSGGLIVHASRGGVADESAIAEGVERRAWSAAVDVWLGEPSVNPRFAERCFLATPHVAGYMLEGKIRGSVAMAKALEDFSKDGFAPLTTRWEILQSAMKPQETEAVSWNDHDRLLARLRGSRALEEDTKAFLRSLRVPDPARGFDRLRAAYPLRREILPEWSEE